MSALLVGICALLLSQEAPAAAAPGDTPGAESAAASAPPPADRIERSGAGLLDVRLRDVDLAVALEMLSEQTDANIVVHKGVSGKVTMVLRKVTFEEALGHILSANGLTYELRGNTVHVRAVPEAPEPAAESGAGMRMRVFRLSHVNAADAEAFIKPLLSKTGAVSRSKDAKVGIQTSKEEAGGIDAANADVLVVVDFPDVLERVAEVIAEIDTRPLQVLVEATILRATLNEQNALGIDFNTLAGIDFQAVSATVPAVTGVDLGNVPADRLDRWNVNTRTEFNNLAPNGGFTFGIVKDRIAGFIRALEQITDVTIMANPKVLTLNKQRGEVIVGRRDGYLTTTVTETAAVQSVEFLETGTKLVFRPFIARDGYVRMEVHPEDSNGGLTAANLPFQETTEATTNILLKDGHTIVIGGLFRERSNSGKTQVPGFGNIPVVGNLLGITQDQTVREEVIILLTVHVLKDNDAERARFADLVEDTERVRVGARVGLMGFGRERLAEGHYAAAIQALQQGERDRALTLLRWCLQLHPRHADALRLEERLQGERNWQTEGTSVRGLIRELIRQEAGQPRGPLSGRPDVEGMLRAAPPMVPPNSAEPSGNSDEPADLGGGESQ